MKQRLTLALALLSHAWLSANCLLYKIPLESRFKNCNQLVDATVVSSEAVWNKEHTCIYTLYKLQVLQNLSPKSVPAEIHVVVPGGIKDGIFVSVEPNISLKAADRGIFLLKNNEINLETTKNNCFEIYSLSQGFLAYDAVSRNFHDIFGSYPTNEILELISSSTGAAATLLLNEPKTVTSYNNNKIAAPAIIDFSPASISAGTLSLLTIRGTGFGSYAGAATVQFRNPDMTNSNYFASVPDASYINTWTDTLIKVIVPGSSIFNRPGAGTGFIKVIDSDGNVTTSSQTLTVTFNQTEYAKRRIQLADFNSTGGYDFTLNADFQANTAAADAFKRALDSWKCETKVNANIKSGSTPNACYNVTDGLNTIAFSSSTCTLPAGALGITYSSFSFCNTTQMVFTNMDMLFNPAINWNYTTNAPSGSQVDFESVALHELGHALGEGHNSNANEVMYPTITYGVMKRTLNAISDVASVNDILARSTATQVCIYGKHKLGNACASQNPVNVQATFQSNKTSGCAPLQVQFTDQSNGTPTTWKWDINNDGSVDFVTQNPTFTYVNPGTYSVKLVVSNANGKDSTVKTGLITVYAPLNISMSTVKNVSCFGGNDGQLKGTVTGGNGNYSYNWSNLVSGSNQVSNLKAGQYSLTVSDASGCPTTSAQGTITQPNSLQITSTTRTSGSSGQASITVSGGTAPYSYLWNTAPAQTTATATNLTPGTYTVTVTDFNTCTAATNVNIGSPTAVPEAEQQFEILNFYPNPARDNVNLQAELKDYQDVNIELIDLSGRTVAYQDFPQTREINTSFDLSTLSAGLYIFRIKTPEGDTFRKVQKQ